MSSRAELREAVRRLREAAEARAVGRLGTGAGTRADQEALRRIARDTLREILPGELAGLERPSPPEAGTASRLAALERRLERLEARLGPRPAEKRRPAARAMVFLPAPWEAGRRLPGAAVAALLAGLLLLGAASSAGHRASVRAEPGTTPAPPSAAASTSAPATVAAAPGGPALTPWDVPRGAGPSATSPAAVGPQAAEPRPEPQRAAVADPSPSHAEGTPADPSPAEVATTPAPARVAGAAAFVRVAGMPPPPTALATQDDAAPTGGAPPAAETSGPAPLAPPPPPAAKPAAGPAGAARVASAAPAPGRFAIQVASLRDPAGAAAAWRRLVRLHPSLAGLEPRPARVAEVPGEGRFYRVLGGAFATRAEAAAACARLLAEGSYCRPVPL